ncbi:MAG: C40 family peptidase [Bacillota bacterium]|nr:C40 family peptidase [Bacillota bacterium]
MKIFKMKTFTVLFILFITALSFNVKPHIAKADAFISNKQGVMVHSTDYKSNKVVKAPVKTVQSGSNAGSNSDNDVSSKTNRGGSENLSLGADTASSGSGTKVVSYAFKYLGSPYVWGAAGPRAFDCSGFTMYVYSAFGIGLDHYTGSQFGEGQPVSRGNLAPGDLVFFNTYGSISHVGIYIGDGNFIHAANSNSGVIVSSLSDGYYSARYAGARRMIR